MIQIFGTKKCSETRKAERFFRERGVPIQIIDVADKPPSVGELRSVRPDVKEAQVEGGLISFLGQCGRGDRQQGRSPSRHPFHGAPPLPSLGASPALPLW